MDFVTYSRRTGWKHKWNLKFNLHFPFFWSVVSSVDSSGFIRLELYKLRAFIFICRREDNGCTLEYKRLDQGLKTSLQFKEWNSCIVTIALLVI